MTDNAFNDTTDPKQIFKIDALVNIEMMKWIEKWIIILA